ncbi:MAG: VWA domain-containing protein, partial [Gemmatimonadetes bacterium]
LSAAHNPLSTFAIDVDRASYANVRRILREGRLPPADAVRVEELINYFPYADPAPEGDDPLAARAEIGRAPWNPQHLLVRVSLRARPVETEALPPSNLVFLVDVSGSMQSPDKLPLLKRALALLVDQLRPQDRVAIVVYAGAAGVVLESTPGSDRATILEALGRLEAGGSTAGAAGIELAYAVARRNRIEGGNNRVILATDGDFNVGPSSEGELIRLIERRRAEGTFLTVLGFGTGNLQDAKMEQLADHGNGNFAYIDGLLEARKVLVSEMGGTLHTVAKDVKLQVEFNPALVRAYRLIGYENRMLAAEDFADDRKDGGEMGAGHTVTALYELVPTWIEPDVTVGTVDSLRYRAPGEARGDTDELLFVKLRYKQPDAERSVLRTFAVEAPAGPDAVGQGSDDLRFAAAVAGFGMLLRGSPYCDWTLTAAAALAQGARGDDPGGHRAAFVEMVRQAARLADQETG